MDNYIATTNTDSSNSNMNNTYNNENENENNNVMLLLRGTHNNNNNNNNNKSFYDFVSYIMNVNNTIMSSMKKLSPNRIWDYYCTWVQTNYSTIQSIDNITERILFWILPYMSNMNTMTHPLSRIIWSLLELHKFLISNAIRHITNYSYTSSSSSSSSTVNDNTANNKNISNNSYGMSLEVSSNCQQDQQEQQEHNQQQKQQSQNQNQNQQQSTNGIEIILNILSPLTIRYILVSVRSLWPILMELSLGIVSWNVSSKRQNRQLNNTTTNNNNDQSSLQSLSSTLSTIIMNQCQASIRCYIERIRFILRFVLLVQYWYKFNKVLQQITVSSQPQQQQNTVTGILPGIMIDGGSVLPELQNHQHCPQQLHQQQPQYDFNHNYNNNSRRNYNPNYIINNDNNNNIPTINDEYKRLQREQYIGKRTGRRIVSSDIVLSPSASSSSSTWSLSSSTSLSSSSSSPLSSPLSSSSIEFLPSIPKTMFGQHNTQHESSSFSSSMSIVSGLYTTIATTVSNYFTTTNSNTIQQSTYTVLSSIFINKKDTINKIQIFVSEILYIVRPLIQAEMYRIAITSSSSLSTTAALSSNNNNARYDIDHHQQQQQQQRQKQRQLLFRTWILCLGMDCTSLVLLNNIYSNNTSMNTYYNKIISFYKQMKDIHVSNGHNYRNSFIHILISTVLPTILGTSSHNNHTDHHYNNSNTTTATNIVPTRHVTITELKRRQLRLVLYLLRCPIWDNYTEPTIGTSIAILEYIPIIGRLLSNYLWDYIQYYKYYQCEEG